jgi:hypothetical protein
MTTEGQTTLQEPTFEMSASITKLMPALIKAQSEMGAATRGADNPFYRSKYADLAEVIETCKDALNANGICFLQPILTGTKGVCVKTMLIHVSGEYLSATVDFPVGKVDSQEYGKAISYARRYSLQSLLSIPAEDDDGNTASNKATPQTYTKAMTQDFPPDEWLSGKLLALTKGVGSAPGSAKIQTDNGAMTFQVFTIMADWGSLIGHAIQFRYEKQGKFRVIAEMALVDTKQLSIEAQATEPEPITIDLDEGRTDEARQEALTFAPDKECLGLVESVKAVTKKAGGEFYKLMIDCADTTVEVTVFEGPSHYFFTSFDELVGQQVYFTVREDGEFRGKPNYIVTFLELDPESQLSEVGT